MTWLTTKSTILAGCILAYGALHAEENETPQRTIEFAWETIEDAASYEVEFSRIENGQAGKAFNKIKVSKTSWRGQLEPGIYQIRIRAIDQRGVPGTWGQPIPLDIEFPKAILLLPPNQKQIKSKDMTESTVSFKWQDYGPKATYNIMIVSSDKSETVNQRTNEPFADIKLKVAKTYNWKVSVVSKEGLTSEPSETWSFILMGGQLATPTISQEFTVDERKIGWTKPEHAESFQYRLQQQVPGSKKWKTITKNSRVKEAELQFKSDWSPGNYRLRVFAEAPGYQASKILTYIFAYKAPETKVTKKAAPPKPPPTYYLEYTYAPLLRKRLISSSTINTNFSETILNSNRLAFKYLLYFPPSSITFSLAAHRIRSSLFSEEGKNTSSEQPPIELNTNRFTLAALYSYSFSPWYAGLQLGLVKDTFHGLYTASPVVISQKDNNVTELQVQFNGEMFFGDSSFGGSYQLGSKIASPLESYNHSQMGLHFAQTLSFDMKIAYFYLNDTYKFTYKHPVNNDPYTTAMVSDSVGATLTMGF